VVEVSAASRLLAGGTDTSTSPVVVVGSGSAAATVDVLLFSADAGVSDTAACDRSGVTCKRN